MSRIETLNALNAGISRLRTTGGADPGSLYDLVNGDVTLDGSVKSRDGTVTDAVLPSGSKGLASINGENVVFSSVLLDDMPDGYRCEVLIHPTNPSATLETIWFADAFLGFLYVVAEWSDASVFHYWLQTGDAWQANHDYQLGELVEPTTRNGYVYKANRLGDANLVWAPNVARTVGDVIEPTTPNGFKYECIDTLGANPRSGETEPAWPTTDGATITEDTDVAPATTPTTAPTSPDVGLSEDTIDRYGAGLDQGYGGLHSRIDTGDA